MIIINRALSQIKIKKGKVQIKKAQKRTMLLSLFPHLCFKVAPCSSCSDSHILCFKVAPCFSCSESHKLCFFHTSGNFSLQNLACIFQQWASSSALGLREQASWMHTHLVSFVEFHTFIALVHPLHGNPYSLH